MSVITPRWLRRLIAGLFLIVLLFPLSAEAANDSPDRATPLDVTTNSVSDTLVGNTGGAYRYYRVNYQGGNAPVLFSLSYQPAYGGGNQAFGFNLYGPSGQSFAGQVTGTSGSTGTAQYTLANGAAMSILVQVYNYTSGGSVNFTLTVSGLSGGSTTTVTSQSNTTPEQAAPVTTTNASIGGSMLGNGAGAFKYYTLRYPGGNAAMTVTMNASPVYTGSGQALGFNLYRQVPNGSSTLAATGTVSAQDTNSATISATVSARSASSYQLQVYNYWNGVNVSFGIQTTGLAGPAPAASGNVDAAHAIVLNSARPGATETLTGNGGGAFNDFLVSYPGNQSQLSMSVTYDSLGGASPTAVGFNVYDGSILVATATAADDGSGVFSAIWNYQNADAKTLGVQVFNYAGGATTAYTIYEVGSQ